MDHSHLVLSRPPPDPRPPPPGPHPVEQELLRLTDDSPVDLLCAPVPSCLPSPQLRPDPVVPQAADLIWFEEHPQEPSGGRHCVPWGAGSRGFSQTADISRQDVNCVMEVESHYLCRHKNPCEDYSRPFCQLSCRLGSQPEVLAKQQARGRQWC